VELKRLIEEGKLGTILSVGLNCFWNRGESYYHGSNWRGTKALDGGVLFTQFAHFIDLFLWLFGDVRDVQAYAANTNHPYIEIDDEGVVILKFEDGALG